MPLSDKMQDVQNLQNHDHESQCMQQKKQLPGMMTKWQYCQVIHSTIGCWTLHGEKAELPLQAPAECCRRSPAQTKGPEPRTAPEVPVGKRNTAEPSELPALVEKSEWSQVQVSVLILPCASEWPRWFLAGGPQLFECTPYGSLHHAGPCFIVEDGHQTCRLECALS